jgi:hypothetical protein
MKTCILKIGFQCPLDNKINKIQSLMSSPENGILPNYNIEVLYW